MDSGKVNAQFQFSEMRKKLNEAHLEIIKRREYRGAREQDVVAWLAEYVEKEFVPKTERDELKGKLEKLKQLLLLTDESVSDVSMNEVTARQWNAYLKEFPEEGL